MGLLCLGHPWTAPVAAWAGLVIFSRYYIGVHYPSDLGTLEEARRRLAFDELLLLQIAVLARRRSWREDVEGVALGLDRGLVDRFIASLDPTEGPAAR